jgi:integrase
MAIEQQPNGRFKVRVDVGGRGPDRERIVRVVDTRDEAKALEARYRRGGKGAHRRTVLDAVDHYLETKAAGKAPTYEATMWSTRDTYVAPTWLGKVELDRLDEATLDRFYAEVAAGKHSPARKPGPKSRRTVVKIHGVLSRSLRIAKRNHWITANPCRDLEVEVGTPQAPSAADDYDLADIARVLDVAARPRPAGKGDKAKAYDHAGYVRELEDLVQAAVATGAREGELAGLRWRDVELLDGSVTFYASVSRNRRGKANGWHRKPIAANKGGKRAVAIDDECRAMLVARYERQAELAEAAGVDVAGLEECAVFSLELERGYTSPAALSARWRRAADAAGVELKFHDLRHVNASEMTAGGIAVTDATHRTGHASNRMFHDVYSHHRANLADPAVPVLAETWQAITSKRKAPA